MPPRAAQLPGRVVYGVVLKTTSAIIASRAWSRVKRVHRFVSLIAARKAAGTLALKTDTPASRLPEIPREVWDAIARHIAHEIYREEEDRFVFGIHGTSDDGLWDELQTQAEEGNAPAGIDDRMGRARLDLSHLRDCDTCSLMMVHEYGTVHMLSGSTELMKAALADFGLELACKHLVQGSTFDYDDLDTDIDAISFITSAETGPTTSAAAARSSQVMLQFGYVQPVSAAGTSGAASPAAPTISDEAKTRLATFLGLIAPTPPKVVRHELTQPESPPIELTNEPSWYRLLPARRRR